MPFEFIQIPANGQGSAKEELNKLLRGGRIASVRKEFVPNFIFLSHAALQGWLEKHSLCCCIPWKVIPA